MRMRFNDTRNVDLQLRSFPLSGFSTSAFGRARERKGAWDEPGKRKETQKKGDAADAAH